MGQLVSTKKRTFVFIDENASPRFSNVNKTEHTNEKLPNSNQKEINTILKDDDMDGKCIICWDHPRGKMVFLPCRHAKCCKNCAPLFQECPECEEPIFQTIEIFL